MSYDIIKSITIKNNEVVAVCASSNVYPRTYARVVSPSLTKILREQGEDAVNVVILAEYENGNFHAGTKNKYYHAMKRLRSMPEYKLYDWRASDNDEYKLNSQRRNSQEFKDLVASVLKMKDLKGTVGMFKIKIDRRGFSGYVKKVLKWVIKTTVDINDAKIFKYKEDAEKVMKSVDDDAGYSLITL
jgi:hypothetical protein